MQALDQSLIDTSVDKSTKTSNYQILSRKSLYTIAPCQLHEVPRMIDLSDDHLPTN